MIRYDIKIPRDPHWDGLWEEIEKNEKVTFPYDIDAYLKKYKGKVYMDPGFKELTVIKGIEFRTEEDLTYFKLKFN